MNTNYKLPDDLELASYVRAFSFSEPIKGKVPHILIVYKDNKIQTWCGSGTNSAGQSWRASSDYYVNASKTVDQLCKKCAQFEKLEKVCA